MFSKSINLAIYIINTQHRMNLVCKHDFEMLLLIMICEKLIMNNFFITHH